MKIPGTQQPLAISRVREAPTAAFGALPAALLALLLVIAVFFDGAFALRHWGPLAILAVMLAAAAIGSGAARIDSRPALVALGGIWALGLWMLVTAGGAQSTAEAVEGAGRALMYAAIFTVALAVPSAPRVAARVGMAAVAGVVGVAAVTLGRLLAGGTGEFLAGRLDDPVGYRNATACLFALAFWPLAAAAAHRPVNALVRATAFSGALLVLGLPFLTEARGVFVGLLVGAIVAIGLGPDRLRRIWVALLAAGAVALASDRLLTPYHAFTDGRPETASDIAPAAEAILALALAGFALGLLVALVDGGLRMGEGTRAAIRRTGLAGLALLAPLAVVATLVAIGNPVTFADERIDEFRSLETSAPGETRLAFGGGQRSDIWRVALLELEDEPITGVGAGNYSFRYYEERRNDRNLSTPHSLPFELVSETGAVGGLAFLGFLGGVVWLVAVRWRHARPEARWMASGLLAAGAVVFGQAVVDWIWLIPSVVGLAMLLIGLGLAALASSPEAPARLPAGRGRVVRLGLGLVIALTAVPIGLVYLADTEVRRARAADATPEERLDAAERAERLNPWAVTPRYLQAGALEDLGRRAAAREELLGALAEEPRNFVTLGLLGDLELRAGREAAANGYYQRAARLNPLDTGLSELVRRTEG